MGVRFRRQWTEAYVKLIVSDQRERRALRPCCRFVELSGEDVDD